MPRRRSRRGDYPSPYTAILEVDGVMYRIADRGPSGFRAVRLTRAETETARRAFDDVHADVEARLVGARGA